MSATVTTKAAPKKEPGKKPLPLDLYGIQDPLVRAALEYLLGRVEALEEANSRSRDWDPQRFKYKGDAYWHEFWRQFMRLLGEKTAISLHILKLDPWFQKEAHVYASSQWVGPGRTVDVLTRGMHRPVDIKADLVSFEVRGRGKETTYVARREALHCAIEMAARYSGVREPGATAQVNRLRREWGATEEAKCSICGGPLV